MFGKLLVTIKHTIPWVAATVVASVGIVHGYPWMVVVMVVPVVAGVLSDIDLRKYAER